jgi:hypothetical protein
VHGDADRQARSMSAIAVSSALPSCCTLPPACMTMPSPSTGLPLKRIEIWRGSV